MITIKRTLSLLLLFTFSTFVPAVENNSDSDSPAISSAGKILDERFEVTNYSFLKKFDPRGKGDYLDIFFDIKNKTDETIALKLFIMGFYETNKVPKNRRYTKYPNWRKYDCDRATRKIVFFDSNPKIERKDVFNIVPSKTPLDLCRIPNKLLEKEVADRKSDTREDYPSFLQYVNYAKNKPDSGLELTLYNLNDGDNLKSKEERQKRTEKSLVIMKPLKTVVYSKLFSKYRTDQKFFNHFGIVLYDTNKKKVVYQQFIRFKDRFKIY